MTSLGVQAPEAPATLRRIPATGDLLLIWNNTFTAGIGHGGPRTPLTAAVSNDEGETWKIVDNLEANPDRTAAPTPKPSQPASPKMPVEDTSTTSRLLDLKRKRQQDGEK